MANLDGSRSHGGRFDPAVSEALLDDLAKLGEAYRAVLSSARRAGVDAWELPDFLGVEKGGTPDRRVIY
ncbi:hypothetical protein K1X13_14015 [Nocardioides sp. WL0053]|uniref:Uncharacterized protein n=1 Tax=Nocardioides jiangsuensis TaxID=2866161 RepID=A0ABS7RLM0_9ACTN|nr:hypothetical protein [Nocardioides jiangsuensis]MBY9075945.1 hypothetical protein [Nocardioides jiangsuensis]